MVSRKKIGAHLSRLCYDVDINNSLGKNRKINS